MSYQGKTFLAQGKLYLEGGRYGVVFWPLEQCYNFRGVKTTIMTVLLYKYIVKGGSSSAMLPVG